MVGHDDSSTSANNYSHLDYKTKMSSADAILSVFDFANQHKEVESKIEDEKPKEELKKIEELKKLAEKEEQNLDHEERKRE